MTESLRSRTIRGLIWSFAERIGQQAIQFAFGIILARMLMPAEFGLIGMLMIFMAIGQAFIDSGFGQSLIQKQDATRIDESSAFYFNIVRWSVGNCTLWFIAPLIAAFYDRPILVPLTRAMSLNLFIGSFGIVQTALMTKRVDFRTQMRVSLIASTLGGDRWHDDGVSGVWCLESRCPVNLRYFSTHGVAVVFSPLATLVAIQSCLAARYVRLQFATSPCRFAQYGLSEHLSHCHWKGVFGDRSWLSTLVPRHFSNCRSQICQRR